MLSRIARGLYSMAREIERAQNVVRILEVNHKMNLERGGLDAENIWLAVAEAFGLDHESPNEAALYTELVLSDAHAFSVKRCIGSAREEGRAKRDHISEEMWSSLNRYHLSLAGLTFEEILLVGRSEFNAQVGNFCDAFHGLADDTMMQRAPWHFLQIGRFLERAEMICRILEIKRKSLSLAPGEEGRPIDEHQWQALLRSLSAYEPYRRAHDARIVPARALGFVLQSQDFPRSLRFSLERVESSLRTMGAPTTLQLEVRRSLEDLIWDVRQLEPRRIVSGEALGEAISSLLERCESLSERLDRAYFRSLRLAPARVYVDAAAQASQ